MYIKLTNNEPTSYSLEHLRRDNPGTSFPQFISNAVLAEWNVYPVKQLPSPSFDPLTHYLKQSEFYQVDNSWQVHYSAAPLPRTQVEQTMLAERNRLLLESDWVVTRAFEQQTPVPDEWVDYRQKLRDLPAQQNFPYDIIWPSQPS